MIVLITDDYVYQGRYSYPEKAPDRDQAGLEENPRHKITCQQDYSHHLNFPVG
jgi:hypothetical protein